MLCSSFSSLDKCTGTREIMNKIPVLYISNDDRVMAGASYSLFNMIRSVMDKIEPVVLVAEDGDVYKFFTSHKIECIIVPFLQLYYFVNDKNPITRALRYVKHIYEFEKAENECVEKVFQRLKDRNVQIVHSNSTIITVGIKIAHQLGAKHIWHVREFLDLDFQIKPFRGRRRLEHQVHQADAAIAITRQVYNHWRLDRALRSCVLWNAVRKKADACFEKNKEHFYLFCCARLSDSKGADVAVKCFGLSGLASKDYQLRLIGLCDEGYRKKLDAIAKQYGCEEQVIYLGYQSDIKPYMSKAKAFLMTSLNEGMGRTTIEAMFFGCPVIARHSGGTVDFMKDGETGFFFEKEAECVALMKRLAEETPANVIHAAQQLAIECFSEEEYGKNILNIYQDVIDGK